MIAHRRIRGEEKWIKQRDAEVESASALSMGGGSGSNTRMGGVRMDAGYLIGAPGAEVSAVRN